VTMVAFLLYTLVHAGSQLLIEEVSALQNSRLVITWFLLETRLDGSSG